MFSEGQQIGSYTLLRKLGKGGFGEVWLAEKRSQFVTKKVAVKLPLDEQINFDAIRQEAELWEQASGHANVLPIIDADIIDGQVVIVSEYADGGSLHDKLKREGKLAVKQAVEMTVGILNGLEFLHNRKIIHRDIKPQNILLQGDTPRLADFGISRAMQTTAISSTIIGTDAYMSPEAFDGKRSVQTDIWSVGVVLYQLLTGNLPFPQEHPSEKMFAILQKDFEILPNDVPQNLKTIITKALAKLPENRYQTSSEMREDLQRVLRDEVVSNFVQSDSRQNFSVEQIPPTQKFTPFLAQNLQDESETVVRSAPISGQSEKPKIVTILMYALLTVVLVGGLGYFLTSDSKQNGSNKNKIMQLNERQSSKNSTTAPITNSSAISNVNMITPTITPTETPISYAGIYRAGNSGNSATLTIKEIGDAYPKPFNFTIQIDTQVCGGEIEGTAKWLKNNTATSKVKNDNYDATNEYDEPYCELTFVFVGKKVVVKQKSLYGCNNFHGARCSGFDGTYTK